MIKTKDLIEFLGNIHRINPFTADKEMVQIIIHRLKYLEQIKEEASNIYSGIVASELFENNDL